MKARFTCQFCGATGDSRCSRDVPFPHCSWYQDYKGLVHGCLYCRSCGAVYDTIGSLITPIKLLFGKMPSKIVAAYHFQTMMKLTIIGNQETPSLRSMNPFILSMMEEDGRLERFEDIDEEPSLELLKKYSSDNNPIVRLEAERALSKRA